LRSFFENSPQYEDYTLCLAGEKETIAGDLFGGVAHPDLSVGDFKHLYAGQTDYDSINDVSIKNMIGTVNSLCVDVIGYDAFGKDLGTHTLALIKSDEVSDLSDLNYGNTYFPETNDSQGLRVYGNTFAIAVCFPGDTTCYYLLYDESVSTELTYTTCPTNACPNTPTSFHLHTHNTMTTSSDGSGVVYWIFSAPNWKPDLNYLWLHDGILTNNTTHRLLPPLDVSAGMVWTSDLAYSNITDGSGAHPTTTFTTADLSGALFNTTTNTYVTFSSLNVETHAFQNAGACAQFL